MPRIRTERLPLQLAIGDLFEQRSRDGAPIEIAHVVDANVELVAFRFEYVARSAAFAVLLQHEHSEAGFRQQSCGAQTADAAADDDRVPFLVGYFFLES